MGMGGADSGQSEQSARRTPLPSMHAHPHPSRCSKPVINAITIITSLPFQGLGRLGRADCFALNSLFLNNCVS